MADWTTLRYVVGDVEGNGQQLPELVELAVVPIKSGELGEPQSWLVRPEHPIIARHFLQLDAFARASDAEIARVARPWITTGVDPVDAQHSRTPTQAD